MNPARPEPPEGIELDESSDRIAFTLPTPTTHPLGLLVRFLSTLTGILSLFGGLFAAVLIGAAIESSALSTLYSGVSGFTALLGVCIFVGILAAFGFGWGVKRLCTRLEAQIAPLHFVLTINEIHLRRGLRPPKRFLLSEIAAVVRTRKSRSLELRFHSGERQQLGGRRPIPQIEWLSGMLDWQRDILQISPPAEVPAELQTMRRAQHAKSEPA